MLLLKAIVAALVLSLLSGCGKPSPKQSKLLPEQDRWVQSISLSGDSTTKHVGKTNELLIVQSTAVTTLNKPNSVSVGDVIDGVEIGAIKCMFFQEDAFSGKEQYMWLGRWGCQAGRSQEEVTSAVKDNGTKAFDYIYISPVNLN